MFYFKLHIGDWKRGAGHLTLEEEAIYFRLICSYYDKESPIPLDIEMTCRKLRLSDRIEVVAALLDEFFDQTDQGWRHKYCDQVIADYKALSEVSRVNGRKGGRPPKKRNESHAQNPAGSQQEPSGFPAGTGKEPSRKLTTNHKPETTNHEPNGKRFTKPNIEKLTEAFTGKVDNPGVEASKFFNFYESKGWQVGNSPMKSWPHAVANWVTRVEQNTDQTSGFIEKATDRSWAEI